jgi:hypothetical protein
LPIKVRSGEPLSSWHEDLKADLRKARRSRVRMIRFPFTPAPVYIAANLWKVVKMRRQGYRQVFTVEGARKWFDVTFLEG